MMIPLKNQFAHYWKKQSQSQRIVMIALLLAALILVPVLINWANTPTYSVAYSGLSEADAGQVVQKLDENRIPYRLRDSGTILVPADQVYDVRLRMAREGLPKTGTVGYELFSGNTLGMTEFSQKVNYQRALEGELERTISNLEAVEGVRVHVVTPERSLLSSEQSPTTASVTIQERVGQTLDAAQVRSITHLVASSVEGLQPENVVVVDSAGNMLAGGGTEAGSLSAQTDDQRTAELSAAMEIRKRVQLMMDRILGPNRSIVQAAVAMDWTQREIISSTMEQQPTPIVRSSQKVVENYTTSGAVEGGVPGADSNLPNPLPPVGEGEGASNYSRTEETYNYEVSQVEEREIQSPGQITRISISVMVDGLQPAELNTIRAAVAAAAGIDESRGDQVVVESMAFDRSYFEQQAADIAQSEQTNLYIQIGMAAAAVILLAALVIFFSRQIRALRAASSQAWKPVMMSAGDLALYAQSGSPGGQISAPQAAAAGLSPGNGQRSMFNPRSDDVMMEFAPRFTPAHNAEDEQRAKIVSRLAEESPATVAEIIQLWLNEDNKSHG
ncbi:MAG: flagellar basal-body MS-ring/collar protein FliF [Chloroflexota bacterium]|jgi:flagellar M-ring protein FliF